MTYQNEFTLSEAFLGQLSAEGLDALPALFQVLLNAAMQIERQKHLGAAPHERTEERNGYANGFKDKTLSTRLGQITVAVPQVREVNGQGAGFYPQSLERGTRSERALKLALAEMYVQGVSTRKVAAITEQLCGFAVSSTQVSQAAQALDETLQAWRQRPLCACPYVYLDARYERVRQNGLVQKAAVLVAVGVDEAGKRSVLGVSVALSEHEVHWRQFLQSLVSRGLCAVKLVISDAHEGLKAARLAVFGGVPWQRCQFHLQQNASAYVPRQDMKPSVAADIRAIFHAQDRTEAEALLRSRSSAQAGGAEVRDDGPQACGVAGRQCARRLDGAFVSRAASASAADDQWSRARQPRDQAAHAGSKHLSQRGIVPASGECFAHGDQRRLAGRQSLPDIHRTNHTITKQSGCSQFLQKRLDTIFPLRYSIRICQSLLKVFPVPFLYSRHEADKK